MKISQMDVLNQITGNEYIPILDPNSPTIPGRNKRVRLGSLVSTGATGATGLSAYQVWLGQGNTGSEQDFLNSLKGVTGLSAYQVWLALGNTGNESEYVQSLKGTNGTNGSIFYAGSTPPSNNIGQNNDYYINRSNGDIFGPKAAGTWPGTAFNIRGIPGTRWYVGGGEPSTALGTQSDFYLDGFSGNVYGPKTADGWGGVSGNLLGPSGIQGPAGSKILSGQGSPDQNAGTFGDFYLDNQGGQIYGPKDSNGWGPPIATFVSGGYEYTIRNPDGSQQFTTTLNNGLVFDASGDATLTFDATNDKLVINSTGNWTTLTNKPTTRNGYGLTDVYTQTETNQQIQTAVTNLGSVFRYEGTYNPNTNTPALSDSTASSKKAYVYRIPTGQGGTRDFGSGPITFNPGDKVVSNGTTWEKWDVIDSVTSVNGYSNGDVVLVTGDIAESTNLYFTTERAQDAVAAAMYDSAELTWLYDDPNNHISASLKPGSVANSKLVNSAITIAGISTSLGGAITRDGITGISSATGLVKRSAANTYIIATAGTDYAAPTNGTSGQALTSNGTGGFGTPVTLGSAAQQNSSAFEPAGAADAARIQAENNAAQYTDGAISDAYLDWITQSITNGDTTHMPSADAIYDFVTTAIATASSGQNDYANDLIVQTVDEDDTTHAPSGDAVYNFVNEKIVQTVKEDDTTHAPSGDAVFDSIAASLVSAKAYTDEKIVTTLDPEDEDHVSTSSAVAEYVQTYTDDKIAQAPLIIAAGDETSVVTAGNAKTTFRCPARKVNAVRASLNVAQTSGSIFTIDVKVSGVSIFSTLLTLDNTEKTSVTAAASSVLTTTPFLIPDDAEVRIDVTQVGDGTAKGLKVTLL